MRHPGNRPVRTFMVTRRCACRRGRAGSGRHRRQPVLGVHRSSFHPDRARPMAAHRRRPQSLGRGWTRLACHPPRSSSRRSGSCWLVRAARYSYPWGPGPRLDGTAWSRMTTDATKALATRLPPECDTPHMKRPVKFAVPVPGSQASQGDLARPTETLQVRDMAADPHRKPTDETAHPDTLVMRVKGTENGR